MDEEALTAPVERPLPTPIYVETYALGQDHRRRRWQTRVATGNSEALNLALLLEIAEPTPVAA